VKDAIKKIDALASEIQKNPPPDRKEALAQISKLSDELKQLKDELGKTRALAEKLQKAAGEKGGDTGELGKLMREGQVRAGGPGARQDAQRAAGRQDDPAEREKLRKQMEALAEKLAKDKDLNEIEKKLAQAMK
jgi:3-methyladenine DNA glycosylase/8-oxoguanine DNA glycosylase